jgi:hypothetical protein
MMARKPIHDALERLAATEEQFLRCQFLAPVVRGGRVNVRIAGIICAMRVAPAEFRGFGVFEPVSHAEAMLVRRASLVERRKYLELFPRVLLVVSSRSTSTTTAAVPSNAADARLRVQGQVEVRLSGDEAELFDTIAARFDGSQFWFDQADPRSDPAAAQYLRQALAAHTEPAQLDRPGLAPGQRIAYTLNYLARQQARLQDERTRNERRLRTALEHAGAELSDFVEHRDEYRVTYEIAGQRHVSIVRKGDLTVQTAGICLSGRDSDFDLASLVGVLRESQGQFE